MLIITENLGPRRLCTQGLFNKQTNQPCDFFTQTFFFCQLLTNLLLRCLKDRKAAGFSHFFESHVSVTSYTYEIQFVFLLLINLMSSRPGKEPRNEEG